MSDGNTNCLEGRKCNGCGSLGPFQVWTGAFIMWTDDGTGDGEGFQFTEDANAMCVECRKSGTVAEVIPSQKPLTCDREGCPSERFTVEGKVTTKWLVDGEGDWVADREVEFENRQTDEDTYTCDECGEEATLR